MGHCDSLICNMGKYLIKNYCWLQDYFQGIAKIVSLFHFQGFDKKKLILPRIIISFHQNTSPTFKRPKKQVNSLLYVKVQCKSKKNFN